MALEFALTGAKLSLPYVSLDMSDLEDDPALWTNKWQAQSDSCAVQCMSPFVLKKGHHWMNDL